jgi:toxin-antitoxin system PIN domain toxin
MILLDVNVLVYAHREETEHHHECLRFLESALDGLYSVGLSELVLSGTLRILTHPKIFSPPTPLAKAIEFVSALRNHPNVTLISPGDRHWDLFTRLCHMSDARGNLVSDAYHAALAMESGLEWVTTDRDFARFPGLQWRLPSV